MREAIDTFRIHAVNRRFENYDIQHEGQWKGSFSFIHAADTQFGMIDRILNKNTDNPNWSQEIELSLKAVEAVNALRPRPRFFVVCGDLIDRYVGVSRKAAQIEDFKRVFSLLHPDIRLVCVCGNHDVGDFPTPSSIEEYRRDFGDDYFSFWVGGVKFIVLNSQFYQINDHLVMKEKRAMESWLDGELTRNPLHPWKHLIGFQHIPPFLKHVEEHPSEVPGNSSIPLKFPDKTERKHFLRRLKNGGMSKLCCGHYHRNSSGWDGELEVVVTSAIGCQLGKDRSGLRIVTISEKNIEHHYHPLENIPKTAELESNECSQAWDT